MERLYKYSEKPSIQGTLYNQLSIELKQILSQSTPLIPEIEKAWKTSKEDVIMREYISNLKLDI